MIDPGRQPFCDLRDDPPPVGDVDAPAFLIYGPVYLARGLPGGGYPEPARPLRHPGIDETGLDIGKVERDAHAPGRFRESFEIGALKRLRRAIGGRKAVAADRGDGRKCHQVAMALIAEKLPSIMHRLQEAVDVDVDGALIYGPVEAVHQFPPACAVDQQVESAQLARQRFEMRRRAGRGSVEALGNDVVGIFQLQGIEQLLSPACRADKVPRARIQAGHLPADARGCAYDDDPEHGANVSKKVRLWERLPDRVWLLRGRGLRLRNKRCLLNVQNPLRTDRGCAPWAG